MSTTNHEQIAPAASTEIITIDALRTAAMAELTPIAAGIAALRAQYANVVFDTTTTKGLDDAKAARMAIREPRYKVPHIIKARSADMKQIIDDMKSAGDEIVAALLAIETPIDEQIKAEENRKAEEKRKREEEERARAEAEARRVAAHKANIEGVRKLVLSAVGKSASDIKAMIDALTIMDASEVSFEEYATAAARARDDVLTQLSAMLQAAETREAEQRELAELRALRAAQQEAKPAAPVESPAVTAKHTSNMDLARAAIDRARVAPTPAPAPEQGAPAAAIDAPAVKEPEPASEPTKASRPSNEEIIEAVAMYFMVEEDTARAWIVDMNLQGEAA